MTSVVEQNHDEWKEIRARVDSIASVIFLLSGGALSLSITVMLDSKASGLITPEVASLAGSAWYWLFAAICALLLLKVQLVFGKYWLLTDTETASRSAPALNVLGWLVGFAGFVSFVNGMRLMLKAAIVVLGVQA